MNRRLLAVLAAVVLAVIGGALLLSYVSQADERAVAELEPVEVLVVSTDIPKGTPADSLADYVTQEPLPGNAVAPTAVASLEEIAGQVAVTDLVPGEQLLAARFAAPEVLAAESRLEIPPGLHQVTVRLDSARVLGGHLSEGDTVGVFVSLAAAADAAAEGQVDTPNQTRLMLSKVLVTRTQGAIATTTDLPVAQVDEPAETPAPEPVPAEQIMVTLAVSAPDAERLVYAAEFETIWLSLEDDQATRDGTRAVSRENIFE